VPPVGRAVSVIETDCPRSIPSFAGEIEAERGGLTVNVAPDDVTVRGAGALSVTEAQSIVLGPKALKENIADVPVRLVMGFAPEVVTATVSEEQVALVPSWSVTAYGDVPPVHVTVTVTVADWPTFIADGDKERLTERAALTVNSADDDAEAVTGTVELSLTEAQ
jgi:hypothetical protein